MERFEQQRTQDLLIVRISRGAFLPELLETLHARKDTDCLLLPDAVEDSDRIQLKFSIQGTQSLNEASDRLSNEDLLAAVRQLTDAVLGLPNYGLDITQVLTATDQVMLGKEGIRLLCLCTEEAPAERAGVRKALVQQIRQLIVSREGMDDLTGFLSNPYCSLEAIRSRLQKMQEAPDSSSEIKQHPAEPVEPAKQAEPPADFRKLPEENGAPGSEPTREKAVQPEPSQLKPAQGIPAQPEETGTDENTSSVSRPFKPVFFTPMAPAPAPEAPRAENTQQPFIPMGGTAGTGMPFVSMEPARPGRKAETRQVPAQEPGNAPQPAVPAASAVHGGIDEATVYDAVPGRKQAARAGMDEPTVDDSRAEVRPGRTGSMDDPTVDDSRAPVRPIRAGGVDDPTVDDSANPPNPRKTRTDGGRKAETERAYNAEPEGRQGEDTPQKQKKEKKPAQRPSVQPRENSDPKKAFWESAIKLGIYAAATVVLAILVGAFLGGAGIILTILAAAVGLAFLFSRGYMSLKWPKKTEAAMVPPTAPNVEEVFTVRLRMISQNLATHQEVIIRENNQVIGSDPSVCRVPVSYRGISRRHCQISCKRAGGHEEYFITDLGSTNGTTLNGERLEPNKPYPLKLGDHVVLAGKYDFKISSDAY